MPNQTAVALLSFALSISCAVADKLDGLRPRPATPLTFESNIQPLLNTYCFACHGNGKKKGDLALDQWSDEPAAVRDTALWERVLKKIQDREMPPENKPQPTPAERATLSKWVETKVFLCDCEHPDPGRAPIRRLNRAEYNNTIRDLLGVDFKPADDFPIDDSGYGFDNMADALSLSPILLEKYLAAAEKIVATALWLNGPPRATTRRFPVDALEVGYNARQRGDGWVFLNSIEEDDVAVNFEASFGGKFAVRARAFALQESSNAVQLTFMLDSQPVETVAVETNSVAPRIYETQFELAPGKNRVRAVVRRRKDGLSESDALRWKNGVNQKGAVFLEWLEIEGPLAVGSERPESYRKIFASADGKGTDRERVRSILTVFVPRVYRRPASRTEIDGLVGLAEREWQRGESFEQGVARAIEATLVSPHFLFRSTAAVRSASSAERSHFSESEQTLRARATATTDVDEFTLASRLSYFLWSSMPDDRLLTLAGKKQLRRNLESEVRRLLSDAKARALVDNFAGQWLQIRNLDLVSPNKDLFPKFDEELRSAMRRETELLFLNVVQADRSIFDFLDADYTYVNDRLARHYGIEGVRGANFQRVSLQGTPRRGVLTHGSVLMLTSNPTRTSPVKRGKWVLETLLNAPPPPPPPNVPELKEGKELTGTLRQRMEQHRADALCASCHARMDPIGFGLEHFDAIGAWRDKDGKEPVDVAGELATGERFNGALDLAKILAEERKEQFARAFAEKLFIYALGRGTEFTDKCALDEITKSSAKEQYRFSSVVMAIARSVPFQKQRVLVAR